MKEFQVVIQVNNAVVGCFALKEELTVQAIRDGLDKFSVNAPYVGFKPDGAKEEIVIIESDEQVQELATQHTFAVIVPVLEPVQDSSKHADFVHVRSVANEGDDDGDDDDDDDDDSDSSDSEDEEEEEDDFDENQAENGNSLAESLSKFEAVFETTSHVSMFLSFAGIKAKSIEALGYPNPKANSAVMDLKQAKVHEKLLCENLTPSELLTIFFMLKTKPRKLFKVGLVKLGAVLKAERKRFRYHGHQHQHHHHPFPHHHGHFAPPHHGHHHHHHQPHHLMPQPAPPTPAQFPMNMEEEDGASFAPPFVGPRGFHRRRHGRHHLHHHPGHHFHHPPPAPPPFFHHSGLRQHGRRKGRRGEKGKGLKGNRLLARFVKHSNLGKQENHLKRASMLENKSWVIRNDAEREWPASAALVHVSGDTFHTKETKSTVVGPLSPGEEATVSIGPLQVPEKPGLYEAQFRLQSVGTVAPERFGMKLMMKMLVE